MVNIFQKHESSNRTKINKIEEANNKNQMSLSQKGIKYLIFLLNEITAIPHANNARTAEIQVCSLIGKHPHLEND